MTTHRVHKQKNYSVIHNEAVLEPGMSFKAKGILWYLLTKPDGWECRTSDLVANSTDGKAAITSGLIELEENGYIVRWKENDPTTGLFIYRSEVFECRRDCKKWAKANSALLEKCTRFSGTKNGKSVSGDQGGKSSAGKSSAGKSGPIVNTDQFITDLVITDLPHTPKQPEDVEEELKEIKQPAAIPPGQVQGISQASPVNQIEAVREGECSAAAPHPGNFERTRYGKAPSPIMSHYGMGYMVAGRDGVNLRFEPRIIRGMRKIGQNWPGDTALTSDGKAIAYIRKMLSQLTQPQHFEAAWARLELAWEEGAESAVVPMKRLSQFEELVAQYGSPMGGAA